MPNNGRGAGDAPQSFTGMFDQLMEEQPTQIYSRSQPETESSDIYHLNALDCSLASGHERQNTVEGGFLWGVPQASGFGYDVNYGNVPQPGKASDTATSGSLPAILTPSSMTGYDSGSFEFPGRDPAHSVASNQVFTESFEGLQFSVPSDADYEYSQQHAGQTPQYDGSDETSIPFQYDQEHILADQSHQSNEARYDLDAYRLDMLVTEDEHGYQNLGNYTTHQAPSLYPIWAFSNDVDTQHRLIGPFNPPIQRRVSRDPIDLVTRASVHGPVTAQFSEKISSASPLSISSQSLSVRSGSFRHTARGPKKPPIRKGEEKGGVQPWTNMTIINGNLEHITTNNEKPSHRRGGRQGKLRPDVAEKALRMRQQKACWSCWFLKTSCTEGIPCDGCKKRNSPFAGQLCSRSGFADFLELLFPDILHEHLQKLATESFISENVTRFIDMSLFVEVSVGEKFKPMGLLVNFFSTGTSELLQHSRLETDGGQRLQLVDALSAPVGILRLDQDVMKKTCSAYIDSMIRNPHYVAQATAGDTSPLPGLILKIMVKYFESNKSKLFKDVLRMHAIHYFMKSLITFTPSSTRDICKDLPCLNQAHLSSRLVNRQIKQVMHQIHRETTLAVLHGIERSLRQRTIDSWASSFCAILMLCLCIGSLQIAADTMIVYEMRTKGEKAQWTRDASFELCDKLYEFQFGKCVKFFHEIYHTNSKAHGGWKGGAFNPLKAASRNEPPGLGDKASDELVLSIYDLISNSAEETMNLATKGPLATLDEYVDAQIIEENGNGRLAAKFLMSFF